jgi:hypothetical protein
VLGGVGVHAQKGSKLLDFAQILILWFAMMADDELIWLYVGMPVFSLICSKRASTVVPLLSPLISAVPLLLLTQSVRNETRTMKGRDREKKKINKRERNNGNKMRRGDVHGASRYTNGYRTRTLNSSMCSSGDACAFLGVAKY